MKIEWKALVLGLLITAAVAFAFIFRFSPLVEAEEELIDTYQSWQPRAFAPEVPVKLVMIDEGSLAELGQWPWPRSYIAALIDRVTEAGAAAIGFDVIFSEPDRSSPGQVVNSWEQFRTRFARSHGIDAPEEVDLSVLEELPDNDLLMAESLVNAYSVLATVLLTGEQANGRVPWGVKSPAQSGTVLGAVSRYDGSLNSQSVFVDQALGVGSISLLPGAGEFVRYVPMVSEVEGVLVPSLSMELLRVAQDASSSVVKATDGSGEIELGDEPQIVSMQAGGIVVPLEPDGSFRVRYAGARPERIISAGRVLAGDRLAPELADELTGRIVIVGADFPGLRDLITTPLAENVPGVTVHAEIIEQILNEDFFVRPDWIDAVEFLLLVTLGTAIALILAMNMPIIGLCFTIAAVAGMGGVSWHLFSSQQFLFLPVAPVIAVGATHLTVSAYNYFRSDAAKREITRQFQHFVSPAVIEDIIKDPERHMTPGGALRELSILFLDVRGFSTITEKMTPDEVISFINSILSPLTEVIMKHEGTVDKYMGDAIMAFWNAPRVTDGHKVKATRAMLEFFPTLIAVNEDLRARGFAEARIGVGINTGDVSVGNMGSKQRLAYSCVGDAVNLAARLESVTKQYGVSTLVGSATAEGLGGFAIFEIDDVAVKGRTQPETIFTVAGDETVAERPEYDHLAGLIIAARSAYLMQDWDTAEAAFREVGEHPPLGLFDPSGLAKAFAERIQQYREDPPGDDWDGVFVAKSK
ncbi:adenylate/guanylate cyclase domain-containing protein [Rhodobacteraceae bacterium NNCM2]|nr:adenylate/guanylate cyclase domain-containing protein [Coraliihabitans acroporae]